MKKSSRHAFTLVELMIVIIAIGILAGIAMSAISSVQRTAKEIRTRATITKIHRILMEKYVSYADRRVPTDVEPGKGAKYAAAKRLQALRALQMIEMPDHPDDISDTAVARIKKELGFDPEENATYRRIKAMTDGRINRDDKVSTAELLYLIVMAMPDAIDSFSNTEIGDTDGNGLKEFLDGWGRPIYYIRWPAGFLVQNNAMTNLQTGDFTNDHDPFDTAKVDANAFAIYPLIYSAGADGMTGLFPPAEFSQMKWNSLEGVNGPTPWASSNGMPATKNASTGGNNREDAEFSYDNITNHVMD